MLETALKDQLRTIFAPLDSRYTFLIRLNPRHENRNELIELLEDVASCSEKINYRLEEGEGLEFELLKNEQKTRIKFRGIPNGHEFTSLLLAILNSDGKGKNIPDGSLQKRIAALKGPIRLTTYVSLTCTNCPDVVQALNLMAILNDNIEHEMVDGAINQAEVEALHIQGVPSVYADGKLIHVGRGEFGAQATEKEIEACGVKAKMYASNAADFAQTAATVEEIAKEFGRIDILVNNAGITKDTLLMRMTEEQWDAVINVNLKSVFNFTKAVSAIMLKQKSGSIISMSSVVGVSGNAGQANYSASKAGIIGFTKSVAKELGSRNIRANAVAPGFIITDMTAQLPEDVRKEWAAKIPLRRGGTPEDIADVCTFLASDMSRYVTGQVIHVCGGMNM